MGEPGVGEPGVVRTSFFSSSFFPSFFDLNLKNQIKVLQNITIFCYCKYMHNAQLSNNIQTIIEKRTKQKNKPYFKKNIHQIRIFLRKKVQYFNYLTRGWGQ